uniref:Uncharacterized protein n=1 Tax=Petromyzon marinus TaxID=7757 RepID=S4R6H6_PETMA
QMVMHSNAHPPIMLSASWTQAVPYKEQSYHRTPSESIANNYTPSVSSLRLQALARRYEPPAPHSRTARHSSPRKAPSRILVGRKPRSPSLKVAPLRDKTRSAIRRKDPSLRQGARAGKTEVLRFQNAPRDVEIDAPMFPDAQHSIMMCQEQILYICIPLLTNVLDYILEDPAERRRLRVASVPRPFAVRTVRAPVPWRAAFQQAQASAASDLFSIHPMMLHIHWLWLHQFSELRFVRVADLHAAALPLPPLEFEELVRTHCREARETLCSSWVPACAKLFVEHQALWTPLVPHSDSGPLEQVQGFFACAATLMSQQLRQMVTESLGDLLSFLKMHQGGNDFGEAYGHLQFVTTPVLTLQLKVEEPKISFDPDFNECWQLLLRCFHVIISSSEGISRVERELFVDLRDENLVLRSVHQEEALVADVLNKAARIFNSNTVGPLKYLNIYKEYSDFLNNKAGQEISAFLQERHSLQAFDKKLEALQAVHSKVASRPVTVHLALVCLSAEELHQDLAARVRRQSERLVLFQMEENRLMNSRVGWAYCDLLDGVEEPFFITILTPVCKSNAVILHALSSTNEPAGRNISLLQSYTWKRAEDIKLNGQVFHWPDHIRSVFEASVTRLQTRREQAENEL